MHRFTLILICFLTVALGVANAGTYTLTDGNKISGEPIGFGQDGVVLKSDSGDYLPRTPWDKFTQESLRQLLADAKTPHDKSFIEPLIEDLPQEKAQRKEINVNQIDIPVRPTKHTGIFAVFTSPVGWIILLVLYAANLFAAYEIAIFRKQPLNLVCGLAAIPFFGIASPIAFIAMSTRTIAAEPHAAAPVAQEVELVAEAAPEFPAAGVPESNPLAGSHAHSSLHLAGTAAPAASALPEPVVYRRGEFSFNRRFFETKLAGFFRLVPAEADKDMVICIKASRGEFTGRRIVRITPNELYLQVFNNNATADEMIPFAEVLEVQIRHKDLA